MEVIFKKRAIPVPLHYQPVYKIAIILAILRFGSSKGKATISKLHLYAWGLRSDDNYELLKKINTNNNSSNIEFWGVEPALERAVIIANIKDYCIREEKGNRLYFKITKKGDEFLDYILRNELFEEYIYIIKNIGIIAESKVDKLKKGEI
jgi:predicted transcriptional regulator